MTLTDWIAFASVQLLTERLATTRLMRPTTTITTSTAAVTIPISFSRGGGVWRNMFSGIGFSGFRRGRCALRFSRGAAVNDAEHHRNEQKRGGSCEDEAADHGAAERRVLFTALAQAQCHRRHAD